MMRHACVFSGLLTATVGLLLAAASDSANAATLPNGGSISDAIAVSGEQDVHDFTASAGDHVVLRIVDTSGGGLYPRIELSGPSGFIDAGSGSTVGSIEVDATETGTFTVLVRDDSSSGPNDLETGGYDLYFVRIPGAAELGALANDSRNLQTIDVGDLDTFTLGASAGDHLVVRIADTSGGAFYPRLELYAPDGTLVDAGEGPIVGTVEHDAIQSGTFTLLVKDDSVSGGSDAGSGSYDLYTTRIPGAGELGALANDSLNAETIDPGDLDTYTLAASAGDHLVLRIADTSGGAFYPRIELYGPDGTLVAAGDGSIVGTVEHDATQSGTFTLLVKDNSVSGDADAGSGSYDLYTTRIPGADELGLLLDEVDAEETVDLGDLDTFVFDSLTGANLSITIEDLSGTSFYPRAELYRPDGTLAAAATGSVSGSLAYLTAEAGTFTVLVKDDSVSGGGDSGAGDYRLSFDTDMPFVSPVPALSPIGAAGLALLVALAGRLTTRRAAHGPARRPRPRGR